MVKQEHAYQKKQKRLRILNPNPFFPEPIPENPNPLWDFEEEEED